MAYSVASSMQPMRSPVHNISNIGSWERAFTADLPFSPADDLTMLRNIRTEHSPVLRYLMWSAVICMTCEG